MEESSRAFVEFARVAEPRLRYALVAACGADLGMEAVNAALTYGWEHWDRVGAMDHPIGYLFRVGRSKARRRRMTPRADPVIPEDRPPWVEPHLSAALQAITPRQRVVVILVEAFQWTHRETAEVLGISVSSVQSHLERGLARLRAELGVGDE